MVRVRIEEKKNILNSLLTVCGFSFPLVIKWLFEKIYVAKYSYYWSYLGTTYTPNYDKVAITWVLAVLFAAGYAVCSRNKRGILLGMLINVSAIPSLSIYWMKNQPDEALFLIVVYWLIWFACTFIACKLSIGINNTIQDGENGSAFVPDKNNAVLMAVYIWTAATTLYLSMRYGGLRLFVDLYDVYEYRLSGISMTSIENYIFAWNTNALLPILMGIHYLQKRPLLFASDIVFMMFSYGIFGNKSMLMTIPLVIGVILLREFGLLNQICNMVGIFIIIYVCLSFASSSLMIIGMGDRILNGPAAGHYNYYDFFSNQGNPFLYLRESIFRIFADSPYGGIVTQLIGSSSKYYSGAYNNMNNGLFSMAYANFGMVGVIIQPILIVATYCGFLWIVDSYDDTIQCILTLVYVLFLISTSFFSWLLTGGVVIGAAVLLTMKRFDCLRLRTEGL